jgi:hypothetical protein
VAYIEDIKNSADKLEINFTESKKIISLQYFKSRKYVNALYYNINIIIIT